MTESILIKTDLKVLFSELSNNLEEILLSKAKKNYEDIAIEKYGYIIEVKAINNIIDNVISRSQPLINFNLELLVLRFLPKIGDKIDASIKQILNVGIYLTIFGINVLILKKNLNKYEIKNGNAYVDDKEFKVGDIIKVEITNIKYENKKYACIGKYIE